VLEGLSLVDWVLLAAAAACVGFAKTAIGGVGIVAVALFAIMLPARRERRALPPDV
jgi:uncharacterized membrane protein YfcA